MKEFLITFKFLLKQSLSFNHMKHRLKTDQKYRNMFIVLFFVLLLCMPSYLVFMMQFKKMFETFQFLQVPFLFLVIAIIASLIIMVFFGMFQIIAYFYFSNDVKILTPLPIKPSHYLLSKFFVIYIWELIFSLFIILPFFIIYGIYEHIYIYQWIAMILVFFLLPVIPLVLITVITVFLMKMTTAFKSKDALRMIGYVLILFSLLGFQMMIYRTFTPSGTEQDPNAVYQELVNNMSQFLEQFSLYYPISQFVEYAISGSFIEVVLSVVLFLLLSLGFVYLLSYVLQAVFIESYLKEQNSPFKKKKINEQDYKNRKGEGNVSLAIAKIDFITLLKVPIYAFNSLSLVILLPLLLIISGTFMQASGENAQIQAMLDMYHNYRNEFWLIVVMFLSVTSALMPIASTSFSREGKTNWIMRTLPISAKDHIMGRLYTAFFTQAALSFMMISLIVITLITRGSDIGITIILGLISLIVALIGSIPLLLIGLYIDLKKPMLKWDNPQQPIKQNMNVLISLGVGLGYGTILFVLYKYVFSTFLSANVIMMIFFLFSVLITYLIYLFIENQFEQSLVVME